MDAISVPGRIVRGLMGDQATVRRIYAHIRGKDLLNVNMMDVIGALCALMNLKDIAIRITK